MNAELNTSRMADGAVANELFKSAVIFAQVPPSELPLARLAEHARRFFRAELSAEHQTSQQGLAHALCTLQLRFPFSGLEPATLGLSSRRSTQLDFERAAGAERKSGSYGLSLLAARCSSVWQVSASPSLSEGAWLEALALLAGVALGPILLAQDSGLIGARSARERADRALGRSPLER